LRGEEDLLFSYELRAQGSFERSAAEGGSRQRQKQIPSGSDSEKGKNGGKT
jgi:hypothetical protein